MSSFAFFLIGGLLLAHSGYSSYELHQFAKEFGTELKSIPSDITLETIAGIMIVVIAAVGSINKASKLSINNEIVPPQNRYLKEIEMKKATKEHETIGINDYQGFESRISFIDIQKKRNEFSDWIKKEKHD
ncbi:Piso0_001301 [Millerozyma farinosa CBS 7064]|uniref:Piso0_001301 protein n=1 Tax=Pichia sorbitophila (strain ATCC MYA-4447 / BCRC 22081 / CBS 7064 / NBRC 10061 / NRRL Y-12695) TaxID=559304 RepID=G8YMD8_PICSO|nr:Piso0_001301 [Millerozyma farinosa CBS 7064]